MERPQAPNSVPKYVHEGIDRQDTDTLEDIIAYCEARIEWLTREIDDERFADDGEEVVDAEADSKGTIVTKKVPCGKNCGGCPHGPYQYRVMRQGEKLKWEYLGKPES
ncbi:hypothetical protein [Halomarina pelagica]|uniref:hypothetical protein n=1 Tax=Halomarina pelagica TaxID=2961599 RepID=UPI0020C42490|nr:hypothetical protein [Halomarina sp. BND7]